MLSWLRRRFWNVLTGLTLSGGSLYLIYIFPAHCAMVFRYFFEKIFMGDPTPNPGWLGTIGFSSRDFMAEIAADKGYNHGPYLAAAFVSGFLGLIGYKVPDAVSYVYRKVHVKVPMDDGEKVFVCELNGSGGKYEVGGCVPLLKPGLTDPQLKAIGKAFRGKGAPIVPAYNQNCGCKHTSQADSIPASVTSDRAKKGSTCHIL